MSKTLAITYAVITWRLALSSNYADGYEHDETALDAFAHGYVAAAMGGPVYTAEIQAVVEEDDEEP